MLLFSSPALVLQLASQVAKLPVPLILKACAWHGCAVVLLDKDNEGNWTNIAIFESNKWKKFLKTMKS